MAQEFTDTSQSANNIAQMSGLLGTLTTQVGGASAGITKMAGALARLGAVAAGIMTVLAGVAAVFGSIAAVMIPTIRSMQTTENQIIRLKSAFQSAILGVQEYRKAVLFAGETPFPVQDVAEAAARLRAFQFDPFTKLEGSARNLMGVLGDMAGAMGTDLATAAYALERAMVGEWEIMQNNFQISARMIPALKGLATGTKEYGEAIVKYLTDQKRFNEGMEEARDTIQGLLSNIRDAPSNFLIGVGSVDMNRGLLKQATLYQSVKNSLYQLYDAVSESDALTRLEKGLESLSMYGPEGRDIFNKLTSGAINFDEAMSQAGKGGFSKQVEGTLKSLSNLGLEFGFDGLESMKSILGKDLPENERQRIMLEIGASRGKSLDAAYSRITQIITAGQVLGQVFRVVWDVAVQPLFDGMAYLIDEALAGFYGFFDSVGLGFKQLSTQASTDVTGAVNNAAKELGLSAETIANGWAGLSSGLQTQIKEDAVKSITPLRKFILIIAILAEFLVIFLKDKFQWVYDFFAKIFKGIYIIARETLVGIFEGFMMAFDSELFWEVNDSLKELFTVLGDIFLMIAGGTDDSGLTFWKQLGHIIGWLAGVAFNKLLQGIKMTASLFAALLKLLTGDFSGAAAMMDKAIEGFFALMTGGLITSKEQIWGYIQFILDWLANLSKEAGQFGRKLGDAVAGFFTDLGRSISNTGKVVSDALGQAWDGVLNWISDLPNNFMNAMKDLGSKLKDFFMDILPSMDDIKSKLKGLGNKGMDMLNSITPWSNYYGAMNTQEGLHYLHKGEMVIPEKFASAIRQNVFGVQGQPGGTDMFESGVKRATSRPPSPAETFQPQQAVAQAPSIHFAPVIQVNGNMDKKVADYTVKRQMRELRTVMGV